MKLCECGCGEVLTTTDRRPRRFIKGHNTRSKALRDALKSEDYGKPKLCECGCGEVAPLAPKTSTRFGWVQGQPLRFIRGHAYRSPEVRRKIAEGVSNPSAETRRKRSESLQGERGPTWRGDDVRYRGAHQRIQKAKGKASAHQCICGKRARHWALNHDAPDLRVDSDSGRSYSLDPSAYVPLCHSCHLKADAAGGFRL